MFQIDIYPRFFCVSPVFRRTYYFLSASCKISASSSVSLRCVSNSLKLSKHAIPQKFLSRKPKKAFLNLVFSNPLCLGLEFPSLIVTGFLCLQMQINSDKRWHFSSAIRSYPIKLTLGWHLKSNRTGMTFHK